MKKEDSLKAKKYKAKQKKKALLLKPRATDLPTRAEKQKAYRDSKKKEVALDE